MQIISILIALSTGILVLMNYQNSFQINILNQKFADLMNLSVHAFTFDLGLYTLSAFVLGALSVLFFYVPLYLSLKEKFNAYKRELEKDSISNTSNEAKINVLENKISTLEKALDEALKKNN